MLENLSLKFLVSGSGVETLNRIKKTYQDLRNKFKHPFQFRITNNFRGIGQAFSKLLNGMNGGVLRFGNMFGNIFLRAGRIGRSIFSRISGLFRRMNFSNVLINGMKRFSQYSLQVFENANKKASKLRSTFMRLMGIIGVGATIKVGIEGAANIEQYRNTLETVLKDPLAAKKKLAWGSRLANKTPFETEEVISGMTKLQSYGIEGDRVLKTTNRTYMEMIGDMASAMGKPLEQAIEAIADSRTGELERLKEFGITKNMIGDFGKQKGYGDLFNSKGQIKDIKLFNKALFEMMNSKFGGAMEKQAKTFKGAISTIKGVAKSGLASLMGIDEFGDVIENSPFQILRDKVIVPLSNKLVQMQEQGVFTEWAEGLAQTINKVVEIGTKIINFCKEWKEVLIPLASALAGLFVINKVVYLFGALQVVLAAFSFNPVLLGIALAIAALVFLYRNWRTIWAKIKEIFWNVMEGFKNIGKILWIPIQELFNWIDSLLDKFGMFKGIFNLLIPAKVIFDAINSFFGAWDSKLGIVDNLKNGFKAFFDSVKNSIKEAIGSFVKLGEKIKNIPFIKKIMTKLNISSDDDKEIDADKIITDPKEDKSEEDKPKDEKIEEKEVGVDGSHRNGLDYVPRDGYIAELHKGERVVTATENKNYKKSGGNTYQLIFNITEAAAGLDYKKLGDYVVQVIKRYEEEKEIAEGVI